MSNHNHPSKYAHRIGDNLSLYSKYNAMKARCYRKSSPKYANYGARGITVCSEWIDRDTGFDAFAEWAMAHGYRDDLTLERIDVNGNYGPQNCKWIDACEQHYNKQNTIWVDYKGRRVQLSKLCKEVGANYQTMYYRIFDMGMDVETAFAQPVDRLTPFSKKCLEHGIDRKTVRDRIVKLGWDEERALTTPPRRMKRKT